MAIDVNSFCNFFNYSWCIFEGFFQALVIGFHDGFDLYVIQRLLDLIINVESDSCA